jgi:pilus assembly protein Flp/PilA
LRRLLADHSGATAVEYGLIAALIAVAIAGSVGLLGGGTNGMWTYISDEVEEATS